jgi:deoxyribonuclease V
LMKRLHDWDLSYRQAVELQKRLAGRVRFTAFRKTPKVIGGLDCAFSKEGERIVAVVVVLASADFEVLETKSAVRKVSFPYIPGLLSFREGPVCIEAVKKLKLKPDVFVVDGQGIAHPRRLGLASHLGLFFDTPTIGCAKSRLIGSYREPGIRKGAYTLLKDKRREEISRKKKSMETIGAVVRTRTNVKPVFVSVGHKCLLKNAIKITLRCTSKYRLPEPTRLAHQMVTRLKSSI